LTRLAGSAQSFAPDAVAKPAHNAGARVLAACCAWVATAPVPPFAAKAPSAARQVTRPSRRQAPPAWLPARLPAVARAAHIPRSRPAWM